MSATVADTASVYAMEAYTKNRSLEIRVNECERLIKILFAKIEVLEGKIQMSTH